MINKKPLLWIPSLYLCEALPYVAVMTISTIMYKRLGVSNTDIALYTGWLYLPWVIKPFWSPFVDLFKTKRWWIIVMQLCIAFGFAGIAFSLPTSQFFQLTLAAFWLVAFTSATHDIVADGFYMHALDVQEQSFYVGIRSTFYRIATVAGQGLLVILAGFIEIKSGLEPTQFQVDATPTTIQISNLSPDVQGGCYFSFVPVELKDSTISMLDYVKQQNLANGFIVAEHETEIVEETTTSVLGKWWQDTFGGFKKWLYSNFDEFTEWLKNHFGEETETSDLQIRQQIVGVKLSDAPADKSSIVLNVSFKKGDQSISLNSLATRFEFTKNNWDKQALLLVSVDPKLKKDISAIFEGLSGNIPFAWLVVFVALSVFFFLSSVYHFFVMPKPVSDKPVKDISASKVMREFLKIFRTFFTKKNALTAILFMLLYRLPEAQLVKLINPFMLDSMDKGGLGLTTGEVGLVYGTIGIVGLTIGGILGGIVVAKGGLKRWMWPMVCAITLPDLVYVYLSYTQPEGLGIVNTCIFIEQFGYGFGFTAYMLYLIYFSEGQYKTAHYAICTGFMALGMMLPGMMAGWLQDTIGYRHFFIAVMIFCLVTFAVTALVKLPEENRE